MTRKDYELIAKAIRTVADTGSDGVCTDHESGVKTFHFVVNTLADALANDNPRFNRDTFLKACGLWS